MLEVEALIAAHEAGLTSVRSGPRHAVADAANPAQEADASSATARSSGTASTSSSGTGNDVEASSRRRGGARTAPGRTRGRGGGGSGASPPATALAARAGDGASKQAKVKPTSPGAPFGASPVASTAAAGAAATDTSSAAVPVVLSAEGGAALADLQGRTPSLAAVDSAQLSVRLLALAELLKLGTDTAALSLCEAVPGLLLQEPAALDRSWRRLRHAVAGTDDQVRRAICAAPLLLLLPSSRVSQVSGVLARALGVPQQRARALIRDVPALFVMPPATLSEKLTGLEHLLCCCSSSGGSSGGSSDSSGGSSGSSAARSSTTRGATPSRAAGTSAAAKAAPAAPKQARASAPNSPGSAATKGAAPVARTASQHVLEAALLRAPRLLTFRTATLQSHAAELAPLLGGPGRAAAVLRADPALLERSPASVAAKMALLRELLGCAHQPAAVAVLVGRAPGLLHRSPSALGRACRSLSIWSLSPRTKLRMALARPALLQLGWRELHGRCRWLRRLMLSNGYYHAALRRLPPSLLAALLAALPGCWARLQYLGDSNQEGALPLMEAAECDQAAFEARFPEFGKWYAFKVKQMGTNNPWRGTRRVRGIGSTPAAAPPGIKPRRSYARRNGQQQSQQAGADQQPTVQVVLTEAGVVRSGGATVTRPRHVVQQLLSPTAAAEGGAAEAEAEPLGASTADAGAAVAVEQAVAVEHVVAVAEGAAADSPRRRGRR
ncbi:hypothetical protein HXX76_002453 [Chlamydomonas incerta]|uniref:Uncharacterized protein n=1 Tax=Chlamydomonas incerta TaxID=51695 RepID=A0A835TEQ7_CHLIN|nr:hypothetical protein HXX76_002453 [Chlamydomonas incerta]|eukprot:KAG2442367.1 hypothetical protein HXX76_002453 [Chlamydomonas incerta]